MNLEEDPDKGAVFLVNVNLVKINVSMVLTCVLLSIYMEQYEYLRVVYNCLITILIYNNLIFIYLVYKNIKDLWKK
jgi:hypothetical protein